jgi:arylsulfatase A-like enzyme
MYRILIALLLASTATAAPPNVVMIISDDQAWTDYGFMGHEAIQTPHLDALAKEGALFTRGYVPGSLCRCSLATLVTGLYPHQHGITSNDPPKGVERHEMLRYIEAATTLPALLAKQGYVSLQTGKWWEGNYRLGGFTQGMTCGTPECGGRHGDKGLTIGREGLDPIKAFLDETKGKPFFLWYAPFLPHEPHNPPEAILAKYRAEGRPEHVTKYWAMCEWFDATIGELLGLLSERGVCENTVVVYVADNGWIADDSGKGFNNRSKRSPYDGGLRTPIIVNWPGHLPPRRDETTPVLSLDLVPTILKACGAEVPAALPGVDLLGGAPAARERIFGEVFTHDMVDIAHPERSLQYRWVIEGQYKLILPQDPAEKALLFDVNQDPLENHDLAATEPARVADLAAKIDAWWKPGR